MFLIFWTTHCKGVILTNNEQHHIKPRFKVIILPKKKRFKISNTGVQNKNAIPAIHRIARCQLDSL